MAIRNVTVSGMGLRTPVTYPSIGEGSTVEQVLELSGANYEGLVIAVNGSRVELDQTLHDDDVITGAASTKGA